MAAVTYSIDVITHVIETVATKKIGTASPYYGSGSKVHPGTTKNIEGWKWDERQWPTDEEFQSTAFVPNLWDPELSGIPTAYWQSGIGDGNDLLLLNIMEYHASGSPSLWTPVINHGWYYTFDQDWYLYSDQYQTEYFNTANVVSGLQYEDLKYQIQDGIPVLVRQFGFNRTTGKYTVVQDFRRKTEFSTSGTQEFMVDHSYNPPRIILDDVYTEAVGSYVTLVSGVANPADITALEFLGISDGSEFQQYHSLYNPIDPSATIQVFSYITAANPTEWTVISGLDDFTVSGYQVYVDPSLGTFMFGNHDPVANTGLGIIPNTGSRIAIHYTKTLEVQYEPQDIALHKILATDSDLNPLRHGKSNGFIQLITKSADEVDIIELSADLPFTSPNTYSIDMSNNAGKIIATAYNKFGTPIEGQQITFTINDPQVGTFGGDDTTITAITDGNGQAEVFYSPPRTINDLGAITDTIAVASGQTTMDLLGLSPETEVSGIYTYRVHTFDDVAGMPLASGVLHYSEYFTEEDIAGNTATELWESNYRTLHGLQKPLIYDAGDLRTGAKTILVTSRTIINPHTGAVGSGLAPLHPISIEDIGTTDEPQARLTFTGSLPNPAGVNNTKSYLVIGESRTPLQAYTVSKTTGKTIYSNIIQLAVNVPDSMNGTYYIDALSDIPSGLLLTVQDIELVSDAWITSTSGLYWDEYWEDKQPYESYIEWFRRTQRGATTRLELSTVTASGVAEIPLGFRLKSTGITIASVLDAITYIDPNGVFDSNYYTPSGWYNILT